MPIPERVYVPEPRDVSKKHFYISLVKSALRLVGAGCFIALGYTLHYPMMVAGGVLLFAAEILGIAEEL
jgi:hypothetical protein